MTPHLRISLAAIETAHDFYKKASGCLPNILKVSPNLEFEANGICRLCPIIKDNMEFASRYIVLVDEKMYPDHWQLYREGEAIILSFKP